MTNAVEPRVKLTRLYGVSAPNSKHSALVTPANVTDAGTEQSVAEKAEVDAASAKWA
jgi:hypothetical protein